LLTAISASLCCITPVLALFAGTSSLVSTFSWLEPLRPHLIGYIVLALGFAWYKKLKPQKRLDCNCDTNEKAPIIYTKTFLGIVTVFAGIMLAFPTYAHIFFPNAEKKPIVSEQANIQKAAFTISGMTYTACEEHVNHEVKKLTGIINTTISYSNGYAIVAFDKSKIDIQEIEKATSKTGYTVTEKNELK
jgi:copper chaperone CopZ